MTKKNTGPKRRKVTSASHSGNAPTDRSVPNDNKDDREEADEELKHKTNGESHISSSQEPNVTIPPIVSDGRYRNKQRCLVICTRGTTARYRHLLEDLRTLMPHHKKDSKLDAGNDAMGRALNDIAEMRSCNTVLALECRKRQDAYMWLGRPGKGPTARFHVTNVHTMDELRLTGNCMKGSRPLLSFDESFHRLGHLKLLKELFVDVFGVPRGHPKSKPFVDRVMSFYYADKRVSESTHAASLVICDARYFLPPGITRNDERMSDLRE